jgi:hypothetical protein
MIRQARSGETVLVKSREMTGIGAKRSRGGCGGEGVKTTENKILCPVGTSHFKRRPVDVDRIFRLSCSQSEPAPLPHIHAE